MLSFIVFFLALAAPLSAQDQPGTKPSGSSASQSVPKHPADILRLASTMNGMDGPSKPWHITLSYDQFDEQGDNVHSGTVEEFYVSARKYKRVYTTDTLTQVDVATESGLYRSGHTLWLADEARNQALRPLRQVHWNENTTRLEKVASQIGSASLTCVTLRRTDVILIGLPEFCFDPGTVVLRYTSKPTFETTYNNIIEFQGHYLARDITVTTAGKAYLKIQIEQIEALANPDETLFTPPPGSSGPLAGRIVIPTNILMDEYLISVGRLVHPRTANGDVHVKFVVGKDGRVIKAEALDGVPDLQKAAVAAMREYRFRPFLVLDQPMEVESSYFFQFR